MNTQKLHTCENARCASMLACFATPTAAAQRLRRPCERWNFRCVREGSKEYAWKSRTEQVCLWLWFVSFPRCLFLSENQIISSQLVSLDGNWAWAVDWGSWSVDWSSDWRSNWSCNWDCCGNVSNSWHVGNTWNVRDEVLNQWWTWHQVRVVTGWAWNGNLAEDGRDDWAVDWGSDQAAWLVPVGSCEAGLWHVAV